MILFCLFRKKNVIFSNVCKLILKKFNVGMFIICRIEFCLVIFFKEFVIVLINKCLILKYFYFF